MKIKVLAFGVAKDIIKGSSVTLEIGKNASIRHLKKTLCNEYPKFNEIKSFAIAVNTEYKTDDFNLSEADEVVIIPPVSGG